jgi:uncharacterized protein YndB with AHSA1/START domain
VHFTNTVTIRRPLADVFGYVADFENIPNWNYAIAETQQSPGPTRVGTTIRQVRTIPRHSEETLEVTDFVPERRIELSGTLGPFQGSMRYDFESTPEGTRLTNEADLHAEGLLRVAEPLAAGRIGGAVAENLGELKRLLEAG